MPTWRLPNQPFLQPRQCTSVTPVAEIRGLLPRSEQFQANLPCHSLVGLQSDHSSIHSFPNIAERIGEVELIFHNGKSLVLRSVHLQGSNLVGLWLSEDSVGRRRICQIHNNRSAGS